MHAHARCAWVLSRTRADDLKVVVVQPYVGNHILLARNRARTAAQLRHLAVVATTVAAACAGLCSGRCRRGGGDLYEKYGRRRRPREMHDRQLSSLASQVRNAPDNAGVLSEVDFALYQVRERAPVCVAYRGHDVCGMGPPSSGGISVGQTLGLLEAYDLGAPEEARAWRLIGDASRLSFADRGRYIADSDYVPVPVEGLLAAEYLGQRAELLRGDTALGAVSAGEPEFDHSLILADDEAIELPSTSHISIVDSFGNGLSMTTTIENAFGSRLMVGGFLLNNELTDFSFRSHRDGVPIANRVEPGKRPRSSMAPTIVLKDGKLAVVVGSPGGSRIIPYVAKTLVAHLDWGLNPQATVGLPHLINRFGAYDIEESTSAEALAEPLRAMGYEVGIRALNSGLHMIVVDENVLTGGADPRREGIVLGD